ncbi:hypothetical protein [Haloarcula nitratireducens]|uniref:Uncharacterized protein n=1 Tax=Haloarcula nitratireducens TaxID=2487749 RepID=A0AAW4P9Y5_9EURY|nr:hypothetical protein [Halomicroarcula nitratireducens]MBX0294562.1 hypothetical protein [Halomicroarcula nitratireducens]
MSTNTSETEDRYATTGPNTESFDRYQHVTTGEDSLIYDIEIEDAWIQSPVSVSLDEWQ